MKSDENLTLKICRKIALTLPVAIMIMILTALGASAQTCRVSLGVNSSGQRAYMEVYEYDYVSEKPEFPGGDSRLVEFINSNRRYPEDAYRAGVQGRVTCSFVVNADGVISHLKVVKSVEESLNKEALRVFSMMPAWTPGKINGCAVPVRVIRSIPFRK